MVFIGFHYKFPNRQFLVQVLKFLTKLKKFLTFYFEFTLLAQVLAGFLVNSFAVNLFR